MLHKLIKGKGPKILSEMLSPLMTRTSRNTRGAANNNLFIPRYNTDYVGKSFFIDVARLWNEIPPQLRNITNSLKFKQKLQEHYLMENQQDRQI